jgi:hypothetical protein
MSNDGLVIGNAIESGLRTYGQMQSIDANKQAMGLRDEQARMQREQHEAQMREQKQREEINSRQIKRLSEEEQKSALGLLAKRLYAIDAGGDASPEEIQQYMSLTGGSRITDPKYVASKEVGDALALYPQVMKGEVNRNSPEAINAYNTLINVQRGATDGRKVSINRVVPSKDGQGVHFGLNVVNADGSVDPNGVLTDNRTADPNDPVSSISFDELNDIYGAISNLRSVVTNPKIRQALYREHGLGPQQVSEKDQSVIDYNKSRAKFYDSKAKNEASGGAGGAGKLPADAQMIAFYEQRGYSTDDAIAMVNESKNSPQKFVTDYTNMLLETSKDMNGVPTITPDQAFEKSMQVYNTNFRRKPAKRDSTPKNEAKPVSAPPLISRPNDTPAASPDNRETKIKQILAANPGKNPDWAAAYLDHLANQSAQ